VKSLHDIVYPPVGQEHISIQEAAEPAAPLLAVFSLTLSKNPTPLGVKVPLTLMVVKFAKIFIKSLELSLGFQPKSGCSWSRNEYSWDWIVGSVLREPKIGWLTRKPFPSSTMSSADAFGPCSPIRRVKLSSWL